MAKLRLGPTQFLTKAKIQPHEVEELVLNIVQRLRSSEREAVSASAYRIRSPVP